MKRANGMGTIIKLSGNRRKPWAIRRVVGWREDGHAIIKYQGYYHTKREAEQALNDYNKNPYTISKKTFAEVFNEWYEQRDGERSSGTLHSYRVHFKHLEALHDMRIKDIDHNVLQRVYNDMDVSGNVIKPVTQLVNMVFKYAVKNRILPATALTINKEINMPKKATKPHRQRTVISQKDIDMLWKIKDEDEYAKMILVYIYTGLRFSELQELKPENCHDNYIEITHAKTAAGVRIVPICDKLKDVLPIKQVPTYRIFSYRFKALLPDHLVHETRHTFITRLTEAGVDKRIVKAIVGHRSNDVTDIYTHVSLDVMLEAVNKL